MKLDAKLIYRAFITFTKEQTRAMKKLSRDVDRLMKKKVYEKRK